MPKKRSGRPGEGGHHNIERAGSADSTSSTTAGEPAPRLAWYPWFTGDFLAETRGWPLVARGAYRELLDVQWDMCTLPADPAELRNLIRATSTDWRVAWRLIEPKFPKVADGRRNGVLEKRRLEQRHLYERRRAGAGATNKELKAKRRRSQSDTPSDLVSDPLSDTASESPSGSHSESDPAPDLVPTPQEQHLQGRSVLLDPRGRS